MTAELNDYYEALKSSGIFAEEECCMQSGYGATYWSCSTTE
jgi:hypothetical protein